MNMMDEGDINAEVTRQVITTLNDPKLLQEL